MYEISVIIPVFNTEKYLAHCLDSVCGSTVFQLCEVIVIDDGSLDGSLEIAKRYEARYDNVFVYSYSNGGVSRARNLGMRKAHGRYIFFLDSDDWIEKDYLQKLYERMICLDCDMVWAGFSCRGTNGNWFPMTKQILSANCVVSGCDYLEMRMDAGDWDNQIWCILYKKAFLEQKHIVFCEKIQLYEDVLFTNQALLHAASVSVLAEYGYMYRRREGSLIHSGLSEKDIENCILVLKEFRKEYESYNRIQRHAAGRIFFRVISMILYDIGELDSGKKKQYYRSLSKLKLWIPLLLSVSDGKEAVKWLIFRMNWGGYYPIVKGFVKRKESVS